MSVAPAVHLVAKDSQPACPAGPARTLRNTLRGRFRLGKSDTAHLSQHKHRQNRDIWFDLLRLSASLQANPGYSLLCGTVGRELESLRRRLRTARNGQSISRGHDSAVLTPETLSRN
jgi:hypothetical protein